MGKGIFLFFFFRVLIMILLTGLSSAAAGTTVELWCVAKNNAEDAALLAAMNWACGAGGADCSAIQQGGPCFDAGDVQSMASFAFNAYFLKNAMANHSCYFDNSADLISLDPSHDKCKFPSSLAVNNGNNGALPSSSTAVGFGPNGNMSGCDRRGLFLWPLLILGFCANYLARDTL